MMTDEEFLRIARYMKQRYGIDLSQKKVIMNGRLENHIKSGGWNSFNAFMNDMEKDSSGQLEKALVNLLTTNHTYFMRSLSILNFLKAWFCRNLGRENKAHGICGSGAERPPLERSPI